ncbi:transporter [Streptomyces flavovirens]|uniref:transporter n=1 Tax=Streptomyces flavovirens TaxID=52258 RepID=UPI003D0F188A
MLLTNRTLSTLPGHLAASDLGTADRGQVLGMVSDAGIQAGAFLRLSTGPTTAEAQSVYGASFTDALRTCALVGGIGMLAAAVALATIGVRKTAHNAAAGS